MPLSPPFPANPSLVHKGKSLAGATYLPLGFFTFLPFYLFTFLPFTFLPFYLFTLLPFYLFTFKILSPLIIKNLLSLPYKQRRKEKWQRIKKPQNSARSGLRPFASIFSLRVATARNPSMLSKARKVFRICARHGASTGMA